MALSLALDLIGGPVFDGLSASVSRAMDSDAAFTDLLQHMDHTLKSLKNQAGVISEIQQYNVELGLSTIEIMRLSTEMDVGRKLVDRLSRIKFRLWNFFCCYTSNCSERLRKLNRELGSLFATLQLELIRDIKEILILQRQNRDDFDKMKVTLEKILQKIDDSEVKGLLKKLVEQNSGGSMETLSSTSASGSNTEDEGNGVTQAASFEGLVQEAFRLLINTVEEVKESGMMFKPLLLRLKSTLDCLRPFIEEMAQDNKVLDHPEEKLEKLRIQMENSVNLIRKCSSVCRWTSNKKDKYTKQVLELDEFLQGQLSILTVKVARDVKGTSELIRNIKEVVKRIEGSDMVQNQDEFQGSCDVTEPPVPPVEFQGSCDLTEPPVPQERMPNFSVDETVTVGLDVPLKELKRKLLNDEESSVLVLTGQAGCGKTTLAKTLCQDDEVKVSTVGTRDVEETMISVRNTEAGVKPIEESGVEQNKLETKGISRIWSMKIVSDTSSSAGTSLFSEEKTPTFQSKDDQSTDGHISETSNLRVFSYEESGVLQNQIQTKGWSAVAAPSPPTVGLDVVNEQGTRDMEETTILLRNTENSSGSVQIEPAEREQEYRSMGTDVSKVVETVRKPHSFKVHRSMCIELLKLVDRISRIFPDIEAARPRCSTGIQALCVLNSAIEKAKELLQYWSESSKLYLACSGTVMVSRCQKSRNLLVESLYQIQSWVPVILVGQIFQIIDDLNGATFKLDPSEEEAGKIVRGLLHQDVSALNSVEDSELKAFQLASLRLHITSKKEVLIEKRSIKKLLEKVGDGDPRKKQILTYFFYLLKKYENLILVKQTESASMRQQGSLSSENSGNGFKCNQYAEVEPHAGYGEYDAQSSMLPPEEFSCGISTRLMYDPVVIDSGQTYERMWIQKWFDEGHDTCPKTNVKLAHLSLTPNISMKELISRWCTKYGVTIPNPRMQPESLRAWENSSTSTAGLGCSMPFGSLDTSFNSDASRTKTEDGLSLVQIDDDSLKYQYAKKCETDVEFLSNISGLKWDSQCKVVEDVKNYLKCNAQASYSMSSKNFVEPLIKFLRDAHDLDDVKVQKDGFKLLSTFVSKNRNGILCLCEETYSLLASSLDSKVTEEVLAIMEILSGHQDCRCKISSSGALTSILKLLNSQIRNIQGKVIKVLYNLSFDREICSEMVSLDCIPKLVPFFEDSALTGTCISILKNLCDTEGARISIAGTNGCIASVVNVLDTGTKEEQEHAVDILLSLCSQCIDYCRLVMHEGVIPALVHLSANGTERASINSMQILRLLRDIDYVHEQESAEPHAGYGEYEAQSSMLLTAVPPEEFSCGISLRLMYDPVVIASGQTYERMWIQKWFDEGHDTCPKTNDKLAHFSLTPNIAMNESISMWCKKYGVTIPNPSMQPEALDASENSSTSSFGSSMNDLRLQTDLCTMSLESLDNSFNSDSSLINTEDGLSLVQIDDDSLKYQYAKKFETDLEFPSKNFVEPLIKFLRDAHDLDDVKAQRDGFKLLSTFVRKNRKGIADLCEDTYSLLASYLDSKVAEEVLAIMKIVSGHQDCICKISASGALPSILKLLNSQNRNILGQAIKVLYNLSFDREVCSEMVSLDCISKLVPFFEDSALTGNCISILKNVCDIEGARISIAETNGCIASVVKVLDTGTKKEQENAVDILLSLCSQRIDYCHLVMREGVLPALVQLSFNGTQKARINSMQVFRLLRDIDYVHDQEYASSSETTLFSEATTSTFQSNQSTDGQILETSNLRVFRFAELKTATRNFSPEEIIGEGSFGNIFRGWVDEKTLAPSKAGTGMIVAIKKLDPEGPIGVREWQSEVYFLGRLSHPNLVNLLGYCCEGNELLLVYEYMQNRSLENHLFIRIPNKEPLSWDSRIKLAIGAARGLAFLHSSIKQVIYRDFKASNIFLDGNYNAKISTFGLANLWPTGGDSHVSTTVIGSHGYAAPEYIATGHLYVESDVYGFGVVLLEILTGLHVVDTKRPQGQHNLVDWAKPLLSDKIKLENVMDVRMEGQYSFEAALKTAHITLKCLASDPKSRPSMKEVVETLEHIQEMKDY